MGALRKAGVWLGLVEDEESREYDRVYDRSYTENSERTAGRYDDYADDDLEFDEDYEEPAPVRRSRGERSNVREVARSSGAAATNAMAVSSPTRSSAALLSQDNLALAPQVPLRERTVISEESNAEQDSEYRITTLHPTTYNEARTIGEHFRNGIPVIMNLTEMDEADAKRLVDFAAGLIFGLRGSIDRVTNRVFLLSPANVTVTAEDKARIAEGRFFNQS